MYAPRCAHLQRVQRPLGGGDEYTEPGNQGHQDGEQGDAAAGNARDGEAAAGSQLLRGGCSVGSTARRSAFMGMECSVVVGFQVAVAAVGQR
jgi:hypothetical protein